MKQSQGEFHRQCFPSHGFWNILKKRTIACMKNGKLSLTAVLVYCSGYSFSSFFRSLPWSSNSPRRGRYFLSSSGLGNMEMFLHYTSSDRCMRFQRMVVQRQADINLQLKKIRGSPRLGEFSNEHVLMSYLKF